MIGADRVCLNQVTVLQQWTLPEFLANMRRHGIRSISIWRDKLKAAGLDDTVRRLADGDYTIASLCAGGLVTAADPAAGCAALDEAKRALDETAAIGAGCLMFVAGGLDPVDKDMRRTRARVLDRLADLVPHAKARGVKIALEPLHPMVAGTRSVLSTLKLANDWCDALGAGDTVGIAVDTYAVWWDPELDAEIKRAGRRIIAFHVSDFLADTTDLRLDRGMMGDGLIDIPAIRRSVEAAGYTGPVEVEIFSQNNWWRRDPDDVIRVVLERCRIAV
jgi:sugar phosphate isomerase/epimerase